MPFPKLKAKFKTPLVIAGVAIALTVLFQVGKQYEWTGFGEDETTTEIRTPPSPTADDKGYVERIALTTTQSEKTLWDVLSLVGVPASLALLAWWLQQLQEKRSEKQAQQEKEAAETKAQQEKEIAEANQREEAVQGFIDRIAELLIEKNLIAIATKVKVAKKQAKQNQGNETPEVVVSEEQQELLAAAKDVIQARTLSILRRLEDDKERKTAVIRFLADADVIEKVGLNLSGIDLRGINLREANLQGVWLVGTQLEGADLYSAYLISADLSGANLSGANLYSAYLTDAKLSYANLSGANLYSAYLTDAKLSYANLSGADLSGADLSHADLYGANLKSADFRSADFKSASLSDTILLSTNLRDARHLDRSQLEGDSAPLLCNVVFPDKITSIKPNRDCDKVPEFLLERYPKEFKTLEDAQAFVEKARQKTWD